MPTLLHPDDHAFHRMVAAFEGDSEPWLRVNRALRDAVVSYAAERSPYYRSVIRLGNAFEEIPILTKAIVRHRYDDLIAEGVHRDRWAPWRTSGSSGQPMAFIRDTAQGNLENLSARRFLKWMQAIPPDITTVWFAGFPVGAPGPRAPGLRGLLGMRDDPEVHPISTMELTLERLRHEVMLWRRFRAYFIYGQASVIAWVAEQVRAGTVPQPPPPACVATTADTLTQHAAQGITEAFGAPVHSWYGSNEMNGFVGGTLPGTRRYAINPLLVHAEVVDPQGRALPPGEAGALVLTDLNNLVMPFIRYDTGDVAVRSAETAGGFPVLDELVGRDSEVIRFPGGKVLNGVTLGHVLFVAGGLVDDIARYQCAKTGPNRLELRVVWTRPPTRELETAVAAACRNACDPDTEIVVKAVDDVERLPSGKAWIVRDETVSVPAP